MSGQKEYKFESNGKFMKKLDYSLAGKSFHLVFDDDTEIVLNFLTGEIVCIGKYGEQMHWEKYGALRADETTYLVSYEQFGQPERICDTYVLDLEASLVTRIYAKQRVIPRSNRMTVADIQFGAIKRDGEDLPIKRHTYTTDLVGKSAEWHYANGFINKHVYYDANFYRIEILNQPPLPEMTEHEAAVQKREQEEFDKWFFDEPTKYIKIKEGIYLCSFIEENLNRANPLRGGSNFVILINMKEGFDVCRSFTNTAKQEAQWGLSKAYGDVVDDEEFANRPKSPYRV